MSRKRVPLNQNECTADFRIGVPFEQNLQVEITSAHILTLLIANNITLYNVLAADCLPVQIGDNNEQ